MKQGDIQNGARYVGKSGQVRQVVRVWYGGFYQPPRYRFRDLITYRKQGRRKQVTILLESFARWAERREDATRD